MRHRYELWDTESSNLIGTYPNELTALRIVRMAVHAHGPNAFATIALGREDSRTGDFAPVAQGEQLVRLARFGRYAGPASQSTIKVRARTKERRREQIAV